MTQTRAITLNALSLYAVALVLAAAYAAQFILDELPCPLCLLQRILFAALAVGPILNIRFGPRPSHYAMSLLAAVAGAVASARQVLLHIMPGDAGYGTALLGYHYYTWALLGFIAAIVLLAAILLFDRQFEEDKTVLPAVGGAFAQTAVWLVILLTAANVVTTLLECGFGACADNPLVYELLNTPPRAVSEFRARAAPPAGRARVPAMPAPASAYRTRRGRARRRSRSGCAPSRAWKCRRWYIRRP